MLHENDRGIGEEVLKRVYGKLYVRGESASQGHAEYSDGTDCEQRGVSTQDLLCQRHGV